jgi:hypothetical protein
MDPLSGTRVSTLTFSSTNKTNGRILKPVREIRCIRAIRDQKEASMSATTRTTRICPPSQIHSSLAQSAQEFFQAHQLGDLETGTVLCCETISRRDPPGRLFAMLDGNPNLNTHLAILLTPDWLIWARHGDQTGTVVTGTKLQVIKVKIFVTRRTKEFELEVSGFLLDNKEYVRGNLELGPDPAAEKFCNAVAQAVSQAKPPPKKRFFGLINE